ncbi:IS6 family transposase, partial [Martelella mediterranea]|uniref:IS6 family transposase n=1 Tax=Martelella mediterranea TaxID=293089 RepID=UPI003AF3C047|nr:IS6 family transposase [Martelella mediterranea]
MTQVARDRLYRHHRFPAEVIAHAVWLYLRFPLSLRMVEDLLAARGIIVSHQTVRLWVEKFGRHFANDIRTRSAGKLGDKWYLDEVAKRLMRKLMKRQEHSPRVMITDKLQAYGAAKRDIMPGVEHRSH